MYQLKYDIEKEALLQIDPNGKERIIVDDFPSQPEYSLDQKKQYIFLLWSGNVPVVYIYTI